MEKVRYGFIHPAIINNNNSIYPIVSNESLEPGRYAIEKCKDSNEFVVYERGDIDWNGSHKYYSKKVKQYNRNVFLETNDPYEKEKSKFSIRKLYSTEVKVRERMESYGKF